MSANVRQFQADLEKLAAKLDVNLGLVTTKIALDAWAGITMRCPVDTGRARSSFSIKEGQPSDEVPAEGAYGPPAMPSVSFDGNTSVFITSALDYVRYLEDGHSGQAPAGMIAVTMAELEAEAEHVLKTAT